MKAEGATVAPGPMYAWFVGWTWVLRSREIDLFRGCRRQWDLGALTRRGLVPRVRPSVFDLEAAVRMGLATYYFPALDDWSRAIVRPLAIKGFNRAMSEQATAYEKARPLTAEQARGWQRHRRLGETLLNRYFDWADAADDFDSILSDELVWAPVPDPDRPDRDVGTPDGRPVRFVARVDSLVSDSSDELWVLDHRVVWDDWTPDEGLTEDDEQRRAIWALQVAHPQMLVAGTIYNELRVAANDPDRFAATAAAAAGTAEVARQARETRDMTRVRHPSAMAARLPVSPDADRVAHNAVEADGVVWRGGSEHVRRSAVRRAQRSIEASGRRVAADVRLMTDPDIDLTPNPSPERCGACAFLAPSTAMFEGRDPEPILAAAFRRRGEEELEDAGLRRSDERRDQQGSPFANQQNVNFRWS